MVQLTGEDVKMRLQSLLDDAAFDDVSVNSAQVCAELSSYLSLYPDLVALVGKVLAALAREELFRDEAGRKGIPKDMVQFLSSQDLHTRLQTLRAIGNLCIDHDLNRASLLEAGICPFLAKQIVNCSESSREESTNDQYKSVVCGCVLNLAADNTKLAHSFLQHGTLDNLSLLLVSDQPEVVKKLGLQALNVLSESDIGTIDTSGFVHLLVQLLERSLNDASTCHKELLEVIETVIRRGDDKILLQLVDVGVVKYLLQAQQEHYQKAMNLTVLLLGNDKCMEKLYETGEVLLQAREWLKSSLQLHMANAALIIANMARADSKCIGLVKDGYVPLLIPLLKLEETEELSGKLHHRVLSALRNLSLPAELKSEMFSLGVVDGAIHCLKASSMAHVHFKSLEILRFLVQKQVDVCSYVVLEAMEHIVTVTRNTIIPHIHIETGRLLSGIVKFCGDEWSATASFKDLVRVAQENSANQTADVLVEDTATASFRLGIIGKVVTGGGLEWIYALLQTDQPLLIGEGLIALNIVAILPNEEVFSLLMATIQETFINHMCSMLTTNCSLDVINNSLVLISTLLVKESGLKASLRGTAVREVLQKLTSHDNKSIQDKAKEALVLCD